MKIIEKQISTLKDYEKNARTNDKSVSAVAESIKQFGFKNPILIDKNGVIIAGHTRKKAAVKLGLKKVPCIIADDLTPEQVKAFRIADNKTAELSEWDYDLLLEELQDLTEFNMTDFGFSSEELDQLIDETITATQTAYISKEEGEKSEPINNNVDTVNASVYKPSESTVETEPPTESEKVFNHIDQLIDEGFISNELKDYKAEFSVTFVFPMDKKEVIDNYIKSKGKDFIVNLIINEAERGVYS